MAVLHAFIVKQKQAGEQSQPVLKINLLIRHRSAADFFAFK
jgi:hypothetical protein